MMQLKTMVSVFIRSIQFPNLDKKKRHCIDMYARIYCINVAVIKWKKYFSLIREYKIVSDFQFNFEKNPCDDMYPNHGRDRNELRRLCRLHRKSFE